jgi:Uma2 family endonuclease
MTTLKQPRAVPPAEPKALPPLQNGDRLTAEEFERRYDAMPGLKKAELINGVVYIPSPVSHRNHGNPHFNVIGWLSLYATATPGVEGGDNGSLRLDTNNEPQPDAYLIVQSSHGGPVQIDDDGYIVGAPELVAEVAATSANYDLHDKLGVYRQNQVREYVVWRVFDRAVDWFVLRGEQYERLPLSADGLYKSEVLPGLWLDPAALIAGDMARVSQVAQQGIASVEHPAFVAKLQAMAAQQAGGGAG